jgi:hypothetical protein
MRKTYDRPRVTSTRQTCGSLFCSLPPGHRGECEPIDAYPGDDLADARTQAAAAASAAAWRARRGY